jgi:hypothetical protein
MSNMALFSVVIDSVALGKKKKKKILLQTILKIVIFATCEGGMGV